MVKLRLTLLHWKSHLRARLEAVWKNRWSGVALGSVATAVLAWLVHWAPPPGIAVTVMGVMAAIMSLRTKATGTEKAIWMLIISFLVVVEITAINRDRFSNELSEKIRAEEERQRFTTIGKGIETNIEQSQKQFEATIGAGQKQFNATLTTEKNNLARTLKGLKETVNAATGGDGFCYIVVIPPHEGRGTNVSGPKNVTASVIPQGKYPLTNVNILVADDDMMLQHLREASTNPGQTAEEFGVFMDRAQEWIHIGDLPPQFSESISMRAATVGGDSRLLTITFWANNGHWTEKFALRRVNGKWLRLTRVWRDRLDKKKNAFVADLILNQVDDGFPEDTNTKDPHGLSASP
jgi:hypothetical protein